MQESTVKVHVRHILNKLKATNRTEAVFRARRIAVSEHASVLDPRGHPSDDEAPLRKEENPQD